MSDRKRRSTVDAPRRGRPAIQDGVPKHVVIRQPIIVGLNKELPNMTSLSAQLNHVAADWLAFRGRR